MEDFYEHIDDYINGLLSSEALALFEAELGQNESLRIAVDNYDAAKSISEGLLEVDMMKTLQGISNEESQISKADDADSTKIEDSKIHKLENSEQKQINSEKIIDSSETKGDRSQNKSDRSPKINDRSPFNGSDKKVKRSSFRRLAIAASVLGLLCVGGWWMIDYQADQERLEYVLAYYIKPVDEDATKSVEIDTVGMSPFQKGKHLFSLNQFEESAEWLELVVEEEKDKNLVSEGYYWLGSAYLNMGMLDEAEKAWRMSDDERAVEGLKLFS